MMGFWTITGFRGLRAYWQGHEGRTKGKEPRAKNQGQRARAKSKGKEQGQRARAKSKGKEPRAKNQGQRARAKSKGKEQGQRARAKSKGKEQGREGAALTLLLEARPPDLDIKNHVETAWFFCAILYEFR